MKKVIALTLALILCLSLCACKNKNVRAVDELILSIGEGPYNHEDVILQAEAAYDALTEKEQAKVENIELLESIRESYEQNRKEYFNAALSTIEDFFKAGDMDLAESLCYDVLNNEQTPPREDEIPAINEWLDTIYSACFAGTYLAKPEYVVNVDFKDTSYINATVKELLKTPADEYYHDFISVSYDFYSQGDLAAVGQQYREYLDSRYTQYDYDYDVSSSGDITEKYCYVDETGNEITLYQNFKEGWFTSTMRLYIDREFFDMSKIDTSNPDLTIGDGDKIVVRK